MITYQTELITVFQSALFQLNSTVITTDDLVLVVDPAYLPNEIEEIREYVEKVKGVRPVYLFFTHSDFDHIVGYGAFPKAITIASAEFVKSHMQEIQINEAIKYDDEFYIERPYSLTYPEIDIIIKKDGETVTIGGTVISFYHAFGHNHDGLLAYIESENIVIAGDYLSDIEFPFIYHSCEDYLKTMSTLMKILNQNHHSILITSHGSITSNEKEIQKRILDAKEYFRILETNADDGNFDEFLKKKNYKFPLTFKKSHQNNLQLVKSKRLY